MPFRLGPLELGLIVLIILIIFGAGRLPEVGKAIGKGIRAFRTAQKGEEEEPKTEKTETSEQRKGV